MTFRVGAALLVLLGVAFYGLPEPRSLLGYLRLSRWLRLAPDAASLPRVPPLEPGRV